VLQSEASDVLQSVAECCSAECCRVLQSEASEVWRCTHKAFRVCERESRLRNGCAFMCVYGVATVCRTD